MPSRTSKRRPPKRPASKTVRADGTYQAVRYSQVAAERICGRIARGEAWVNIANTDGMPSYHALFVWRAKYPEFAEMLAQARETAAELRADLAVLAAEAATKDDVQVARLKVAAYQKFAANPSVHLPGERPSKSKRQVERDERPRRFIVEVRRWTKVTLPDGKVVLREVFPEGEGEADQ
jgi:hypothetical protein